MPPLQAVFQPVMTATAIETDADRFRLKAEGGGFLAKILGMGTTSAMSVDAAGMRLKKSTFGGEEHVFIPRHQIASTVYIVQKPLELLLLGLILLPALGLGLIFFVVYFFSKKRAIVGVLSTGGTVEVLKLKANADDLSDIKSGMALVEQLLQMGGGVSAPSPVRTEEMPAAPPPPPRRSFTPPAPPPPPPPPAGDATHIINCPSCGTQMSVPGSALGRKVRCVSCREVFRAEAGA
jgi:predicted Zn finger-like uncharacterized protein